jgi:hypothetical protein
MNGQRISSRRNELGCDLNDSVAGDRPREHLQTIRSPRSRLASKPCFTGMIDAREEDDRLTSATAAAASALLVKRSARPRHEAFFSTMPAIVRKSHKPHPVLSV